jgi:hypothetical protein
MLALTYRFQSGQPAMVLELCSDSLQACLRYQQNLQVETRSVMAQDIAGEWGG